MRSPLASPFRGGWRNLTPMRGRGRGGANPWTPAMLPPYAWYDAELGQPKNVGYVELSGVSGDYISTPDSAALSFSTDIEVVMRVRPDDWTAAAGQTLAGKYVSTGNQRTWRFYVSTAGAIGLTASANGTAVTSVTVTPTVAMTDAAWVWLRMRLDLTDGANSVATLETAADTGDNVEPLSWTANGTNTGTTIAGLFDSTAPLEIGSFANGASERLSGRVGRCIVRSGFAGTVVADFNADDCYGDGYTHTDGYRWTLGLPKIYDRSGNNHPPAVFGAGSNQPLWLPWTGKSQARFDGTIGNYVSAPTSTAYNISGDMEIVARVTLDAYATSGTAGFLSRFDGPTGSTRAFTFRWLQNVGPEFVWNDTGTASIRGANTGMSPWLSMIPGATYWLKVEFDADNGSGGCTARFYRASDRDTEPTEWILVGQQTLPTVATIAASTFPLVVGSDAVTVRSAVGGVHCAILRDGVGGTVLAHFDAAKCGQNGYTDTIGSVGPVWTVARSTSGRKTVVQSPVAGSARSLISLGTDDSETLNAGVMPPMTATTPASVLAVHRTWGTIASNSTILDTRATNAVVPGLSLRFSGETAFAVLVDSASSITTATVAAAYGAKHVVGAVLDAANIYPVVDTTIGTASARTGNDETGTSTTLLNVRPGPVGYLDSEFFGVIAVSRALTATELGLISAYYGGGL